MILTCRQAIELASLQIDQSLKMYDSISLKIHLLHCSACRNAKNQLKAVDQATNELLDQESFGEGIANVSLAEDAKLRIHNHIEKEIGN